MHIVYSSSWLDTNFGMMSISIHQNDCELFYCVSVSIRMTMSYSTVSVGYIYCMAACVNYCEFNLVSDRTTSCFCVCMCDSACICT
jgi:hypothetical protein